MPNLKAMHSISEVMQTSINSYVWGIFDSNSSLKEKCTRLSNRISKWNQFINVKTSLNVSSPITYILTFLPAKDVFSTSTVF